QLFAAPGAPRHGVACRLHVERVHDAQADVAGDEEAPALVEQRRLVARGAPGVRFEARRSAGQRAEAPHPGTGLGLDIDALRPVLDEPPAARRIALVVAGDELAQ